jgi:glutathione peroxidase-family protein
MAARKDAPTFDSVYEIPFQDALGRDRTLGEYRGDVLLITNTASY